MHDASLQTRNRFCIISRREILLLCIAASLLASACGFATPVQKHPAKSFVVAPYSRTVPPSLPSSICMSSNSNDLHEDDHSIRDRLREITGFSLSACRSAMRATTGFSLTAFRATMRAATGISLTALYASSLAATSAFVRNTMKLFLSVFPTWFRYFLQPFLVLYYVPLFTIKNLTGPTRKRAKAGHEEFLEGCKKAVDAANQANSEGYWPVRVNEEGFIEAVLPPHPEKQSEVAVVDAVADSVELALESEHKGNSTTA